MLVLTKKNIIQMISRKYYCTLRDEITAHLMIFNLIHSNPFVQNNSFLIISRRTLIALYKFNKCNLSFQIIRNISYFIEITGITNEYFNIF